MRGSRNHHSHRKSLYSEAFWGVLLFFFQLAWLEVYRFYWSFQGTSFWLVDFFYCFPNLNFTNFCSHFIISFLLLTLSLNFSPFSSFLWWKLHYWFLDFSSFLIHAFNAINFPLSIAFTESHIFWKNVQLTSEQCRGQGHQLPMQLKIHL